VILDADWLARVFSSVVSGLDSGTDDRGLIERDKLRAISTPGSGYCGSDRVIALLRHFQLCLPADDDDDSADDCELFPCRLPLGLADHTVWPPAPASHYRQVKDFTHAASVCLEGLDYNS